MVTEADFAAATRLRLPTRYAFQNRDGVVDASCIGRASAAYPATVVAHRSRGPNFKRLKATTEDGVVYAIDLMVNGFDFTDLAPAGVLRGTDGEVNGDVINQVSDDVSVSAKGTVYTRVSDDTVVGSDGSLFTSLGDTSSDGSIRTGNIAREEAQSSMRILIGS